MIPSAELGRNETGRENGVAITPNRHSLPRPSSALLLSPTQRYDSPQDSAGVAQDGESFADFFLPFLPTLDYDHFDALASSQQSTMSAQDKFQYYISQVDKEVRFLPFPLVRLALLLSTVYYTTLTAVLSLPYRSQSPPLNIHPNRKSNVICLAPLPSPPPRTAFQVPSTQQARTTNANPQSLLRSRRRFRLLLPHLFQHLRWIPFEFVRVGFACLFELESVGEPWS